LPVVLPELRHQHHSREAPEDSILAGSDSSDAPKLSSSTFTAAGSPSETFPDTAFGVGSLDVVSGAFGLKTNVARTMLVMFNLQFKLNDAGVRAKVTPLVGIEYGF
jgi:hypothetical protein